MYFCKIFEESSRNELNSIPGIIHSLSSTKITGDNKSEFSAFGIKYGNNAKPMNAGSYLQDTFGLFTELHSQSLDRLKTFRDKIGAHSDSRANIKDLPSHAEFETLFNFAYDFYAFMCRTMIGTNPAHVPQCAGKGFIKLLRSMDIENPAFEFDEEHILQAK
jgi:hypothetical protein